MDALVEARQLVVPLGIAPRVEIDVDDSQPRPATAADEQRPEVTRPTARYGLCALCRWHRMGRLPA